MLRITLRKQIRKRMGVDSLISPPPSSKLNNGGGGEKIEGFNGDLILWGVNNV